MVIGNSGYRTLPSLQNPANDAEDIAVALDALEFEVIQGTDLSRTEMIELIDRFAAEIRDAEVALFFYAGHGFQVSSANFLVPSDANLAAAQEVTSATIPLDRIMEAMEASPGLRLIFLDACRDNPLGSTMSGGEDGLARVGTEADFLISFATQPGNVAYDGLGENSFFTEALLSHIHARDQDIADMMIAVRRDVIAATGGKQIPWESSSLTQQFQFASGPATGTPETMLYQVAARTGDPMLMRLYLDRFPNGGHVADVAGFLSQQDPQRLESAGRSTGDSTASELLWQLARQTRMRPLAELYLEWEPTGPFADDARRLLETLPLDAELTPERICERLATHPKDATATTPGVPFEQLPFQAGARIAACRQAAEANPDLPHYTALYARVLLAVGQQEESIALYRDAAGRGDLRALVSLAQFYWEGQHGLPRDRTAAVELYENAAAGGSPDAMTNLAYALAEGVGVEPDQERALSLLVDAAAAGSPEATYNLGALAQRGVEGTGSTPIEHFRNAARLGEARAYVAAAELLDKGVGVNQNATESARMLLFGVASDNGWTLKELTGAPEHWSPATLRATQSVLQRAGLYQGAIDGLAGPLFFAALRDWRNGGYDPSALER